MQEKRISVPPDRDSETCVFLLKPVRAGALKLLLDVRYGDLLAASRLLRTESAAEVLPAGMPDYVLASVPLASAARMEERLEVKRSETSSRPSPSFEHVEPRASTRPAPVPSRKASRTVRWAMSGGGLAAVVFLAALSLWNLQPSMDSPAALDTTTLTIRANVPEVTVSVEGMPELECVAPCMLEVPAGEPFALRFRKDGYADVREVVPSDPNRKTLELEIQAPTPSRPELKIRRIPRVR